MAATTISIFFVFILFNLTLSQENTTLKLLHILFRHGDRTPMKTGTMHIFTNVNETYEPYGFGQLTDKGKVRSYLLGRMLRNRYGNFVGSYSKDEVEATSTFVKRTQESLEFVLQGLFSSHHLILKPNNSTFLYTTLPMNTTLFVVPNSMCVNHLMHYSKYLKTKDGQDVLKKYEEVHAYLKTRVNQTMFSVLDFSTVYDNFQVQKEMGLSLPYWVEFIMPMLETSVYDYFFLSTATKELNQIMIGSFIKEVIETSTFKLRNELQPKNRKLFMYSVHDVNIYCVLRLFDYYPKIRPPYNSCIMIETHTIDGVDGFKVFYKENVIDEVLALNISGCGLFCPLSKFTELYEQYFHSFETC